MRYSPHRAIFDRKPKHGTVNRGAQIGADPPPPLTVTINKAPAQTDPTRFSIVEYSIEFSEPVAGLTSADITVTASNGAALTKNLTGSGASYTLAVKWGGATTTPADLSATFTATIPAGVCTAVSSGALNQASTSTDNTITYDQDFVRIAANVLILTSRAHPDMTKIGDTIFITESNGSRLISVDVSTPSSPTILQTLSPITGGASNASFPSAIANDGTQVFVGSISQLRVMNVSNPSAMTTTGTTVTESTRLNRSDQMLYDGGYCYVGNQTNDGVVIVDVSTPTAPAVVGYLTDATYLVNPVVGTKIGNYLFAATRDYVVSIDVAAPASPAIVDTFTRPVTAGADPNRGFMTAMGDVLVMASGLQVASADHELILLDATDPTDLTLLSRFEIPILQGNFLQNQGVDVVTPWDTDVVLYAGSGFGSALMLVDISDPTDPQLISASPRVNNAISPQRIIADPPYVYMLFSSSVTGHGLIVAEYVGP